MPRLSLYLKYTLYARYYSILIHRVIKISFMVLFVAPSAHAFHRLITNNGTILVHEKDDFALEGRTRKAGLRSSQEAVRLPQFAAHINFNPRMHISKSEELFCMEVFLHGKIMRGN